MYCTIDNIKSQMPAKELAELSNDSQPTTIDESVVNTLILNASELIDGYIRNRYQLPLTSEHNILQTCCVDITKFYLYKRRNRLNDDKNGLYDKAIAVLKSLQKGEITLAEPNTETKLSKGFYAKNNRETYFTDELLKSF